VSGAVLDELADRFGLDQRRVWQRDRLDAAVSDAVAVLGSPAAVVDAVTGLGPLHGARDGWAVVLGRLRRVVDDAAARLVAVDQADAETDGDRGCPVPCALVLDALAGRLGLDPARVRWHARFAEAVAEAVAALGSPGAVVDEVVQLGELRGARDPWGVVLDRLRRIPADHAARRQAQEDRAEIKRWAAVDRAVRRGETLRSLVERGVEYEDTALEQLAAEFPDSELRAVAVAALTGGGPR